MATYTADSASQSDVLAKINLASPGDIIQIPAGAATWTGFTLYFPITLSGAGKSATVITYNGSSNCIALGSLCRITAIGFIWTATNDGIITDGRDWRVDHCDFSSTVANNAVHACQQTATTIRGCIDNNTTLNCRFLVAHELNLADQHAIWLEPSQIGGSEAVFIEQNTMVFIQFFNCVDSNYGARYVFRYNDVTDAYAEAHSVQGSARASKSSEIYGNTFRQVTRAMNFPWYIRGGTAVIYNNAVLGTWSNPGGLLTCVRSSEFRFEMNHASGGAPWLDGDNALYSGTYTPLTPHATVMTDSMVAWGVNQHIVASVCTGTHNGSNNNPDLVDTTRGSGGFLGSFLDSTETGVGPGYIVRNITDGSTAPVSVAGFQTILGALTGGATNLWHPGDVYRINIGDWIINVTDSSRGCISANTSTTVTAVLSGGSTNQWSPGDLYKIVYGYPARDQPGRGPDLQLSSGAGNGSSIWKQQASEPVYAWGNTANGSPSVLGPSGGLNGVRHIVAGRDYFTDGTQRPGYTAYAYPHPLNVSAADPSLPSHRRTGLGFGWGFGLSLVALLLAGCGGLPRIQFGKTQVVAPKDAGTPAQLSNDATTTTIPVPAKSQVVIIKIEAVPATATSAARPAQEFTIFDFSQPTRFEQIATKMAASTGTIDTTVATHRIDVEERRWLLFAAIGSGIVGIVLKSFMPAWPGISNGLLVGAAIAAVTWKVAALPAWVWLIPIGFMVMKALGYKRAELDAKQK